MKKSLLLLSVLLSSVAWGRQAQTQAMLNIREVDGSPSNYPYQLKVPNSDLTDNGDGTMTLAITTTSLTSSVILLQSTLQSGATFYVSSGTVSTQLNVPNGSATGHAAAYGQLVDISTSSQYTANASTATASTDYVPTGFSQALIPTSASSRVEVFFTATGQIAAGTGDRFTLTLFRDATNLATNAANGFTAIEGTSATTIKSPVMIHFIDSPATTSSVVYAVHMKTANGVVCSLNSNSQTGVLTVREIK